MRPSLFPFYIPIVVFFIDLFYYLFCTHNTHYEGPPKDIALSSSCRLGGLEPSSCLGATTAVVRRRQEGHQAWHCYSVRVGFLLVLRASCVFRFRILEMDRSLNLRTFTWHVCVCVCVCVCVSVCLCAQDTDVFCACSMLPTTVLLCSMYLQSVGFFAEAIHSCLVGKDLCEHSLKAGIAMISVCRITL